MEAISLTIFQALTSQYYYLLYYYFNKPIQNVYNDNHLLLINYLIPSDVI